MRPEKRFWHEEEIGRKTRNVFNILIYIFLSSVVITVFPTLWKTVENKLSQPGFRNSKYMLHETFYPKKYVPG